MGRILQEFQGISELRLPRNKGEKALSRLNPRLASAHPIACGFMLVLIDVYSCLCMIIWIQIVFAGILRRRLNLI